MPRVKKANIPSTPTPESSPKTAKETTVKKVAKTKKATPVIEKRAPLNDAAPHEYREITIGTMADEALKLSRKDQIKVLFMRHLTRSLAKHPANASKNDLYTALALAIRDIMVERWIATQRTYDAEAPRSINYISLEFLIGRTMGNAMVNLGVIHAAQEAMEELNYDIEELRETEVDAGLGNGGLGRLAACFLDSMATLELPALGYGIRYDFGIFKQNIENGYQVEEPDNWLRNGNPWEICRPERARIVRFYGRTEARRSDPRHEAKDWIDTEDVLAMPYDTPIPGYGTNVVNSLRLWSAKSIGGFNLNRFNTGDYLNANLEQLLTENITKVLYPNDNNYEGKELRLKQQYFLVSATVQDIIARYKRRNGNILDIANKVAIQLNDTHPSLAIPEFMRILIDEENVTWDKAWEITQKVFSYTNHTLMQEALERWSVSLLGHLLPRHLEIIFEINSHFLRIVANYYPGDNDRLTRMSLIEEGPDKKVRMAYLSIIASHKINGVAALHTDLLVHGLFKDFSDLYPERFINVTNGITPRRWLKKANTSLSHIITEHIGPDWVKNLDELKNFESAANDASIREEIMKSKFSNKVMFAKYVKDIMGIQLNPHAIFDFQVKRLHEYKRQLLNALHAVALYNDIKENPNKEFTPRVIMFAAKSAPGYYIAKMIIKFINAIAEVINNDPQVGDKLKVVFLPNYRVSLAEKIMPAADLSEQISLAGTEASGTGNMKFALNGALTIGTMDGANVEIHDCVGSENIFIFGMLVKEVEALRARGYNPAEFVERNESLKRILHLIQSGFFAHDDAGLFNPIIDNLKTDYYMCCADFQSFYDKQQEVAKLYTQPHEWTRKAICNIANMGMFSSDRTINEYATKIWHVDPISVAIENPDPIGASYFEKG